MAACFRVFLSFPIVFSNQWHSIWLPLWLPSCYFRSPSSGGDSYEIAPPAPLVVVFRVTREESICEANCDWFSSCMNNQYFTVVRPLLAQDVRHSCKINIFQRFVKWFLFFLITHVNLASVTGHALGPNRSQNWKVRDSFFIALYPACIHVESRRGNLGFLNSVSCLLIFMTD